MARILIVEDDSLMRERLREMLVYAGHEVLEAPDGRVALNLLFDDKKRYDLVVTNQIILKNDYMELTAEIRRNYPRIKIITITGGREHFPASIYFPLLKNMGTDYVLPKPFLKDELLKAVDEVLTV
jgi:DNA-binding response OmpR family regulator